MREYLLCLVVAAAATYLLTPLARTLAGRFGAIAEIRARDVHTVETARWGGLAMFGGLVASYLFASHLPRMSPVFEDTNAFRAVLISATILVILGVLDEYNNHGTVYGTVIATTP